SVTTFSSKLVVYPIAETTITKFFSLVIFSTSARFFTPAASFIEAPPNLKIFIQNLFLRIYIIFQTFFVHMHHTPILHYVCSAALVKTDCACVPIQYIPSHTFQPAVKGKMHHFFVKRFADAFPTLGFFYN